MVYTCVAALATAYSCNKPVNPTLDASPNNRYICKFHWRLCRRSRRKMRGCAGDDDAAGGVKLASKSFLRRTMTTCRIGRKRLNSEFRALHKLTTSTSTTTSTPTTTPTPTTTTTTALPTANYEPAATSIAIGAPRSNTRETTPFAFSI